MSDKFLEWDDDFLIGIDALDHEHRVLIEDINRLHEELARNNERSVIAKCLGNIHARMQAHFALEEHFMKENEYELFDEHKREHDQLLDEYTENMLQFLNDADSFSKPSIEDSLVRWVLQHIITSDKKMSRMVRNAEG